MYIKFFNIFLLSFLCFFKIYASDEILEKKYPFVLPNLPIAKNSLTPFMSTKTVDLHYGKHNQAYIDNLNNLVRNTDFEKLSLKDIILKTRSNQKFQSIFDNAGQIYNHAVFWSSLYGKGGKPSNKMLSLINNGFGSIENFKKEFKKAGLSQFGSGWVFVAINTKTKKLEIIKKPNAENILHEKHLVTIIAFDVWEHSYYLDFYNKRGDYIDTFLNNLINWNYAEGVLKNLNYL